MPGSRICYRSTRDLIAWRGAIYTCVMRICSLLPSATEIGCCLGLAERLVAVTHECDYPRPVVGLPKATKALVPSDAASGETDRLVRKCLRTR